MSEYHKIQSIWHRDPGTKFTTFIEGAWSMAEFGYLADCAWSFTEKVDGTNIRLIWDGARATVGGRTDNAQIPTFLLTSLEPYLERLPQAFGETPAVVYGEGFGAKIQKGGGNYLADRADFVAFDARVGGVWLHRDDVEDVSDKLGCPVAPIIGGGTLDAAVAMCQAGFTSNWGSFQAEGIVARPEVELLTRRGARIITKIKCRDFAR